MRGRTLRPPRPYFLVVLLHFRKNTLEIFALLEMLRITRITLRTLDNVRTLLFFQLEIQVCLKEESRSQCLALRLLDDCFLHILSSNSRHTACSAILCRGLTSHRCLHKVSLRGGCSAGGCQAQRAGSAQDKSPVYRQSFVVGLGLSTQAKMLELTVTCCWQTLPRLAQLEVQELVATS